MTECDYEMERERRIAENRRKIQELGLLEGALELREQQNQQAAAAAAGGAGGKRKPRPSLEPSEIRRSAREVKRPNYREEDFLDVSILKGSPRSEGSKKRMARALDEEELKALREAFAAETGQENGRGAVDSGRGVRVQGGRIYDSALGVTCHWCRQKTLEDHVTCTSPTCGGGKRMPMSFCKMCLRNRHGEDVHAAKESAQWVCPRCRGSCGPGCSNCCNCGPCRKKLGLAPTRQLAREAKAEGFSNVHDYLIHLETGEDQETIAARKEQHPWGAWISGDHHAGHTGAPNATITAVFAASKSSSKAARKGSTKASPSSASVPTRRSARTRAA